MKKLTVKIINTALSLILLLCMLASCTAGKGGTDTSTEKAKDTEKPDIMLKFSEYDLEGKELKIYTSINQIDGGNGMSNSNKYIQGEDGTNGDTVLDLVYTRNERVKTVLNCKTDFAAINKDYKSVQSDLELTYKAGAGTCDIYINDQLGLSRAALSSCLYNCLSLDSGAFDFDAAGWYTDYMKDLAVGTSCQYLLASDYTLDILRNAHVLYFNKTIYGTLFGDANTLYEKVNNKKWTYSELATLVEASYFDVNGQDFDDGDRYGIIMPGQEGSLYPFIFASNVRSVSHDSNNLLVVNAFSEKADKLCQTILDLYTMKGARYAFKTDNLMSKFTSGGSLFTNYFRLGDFEDSALRSMKDCGLVPYPMLDENQDTYYTLIHDTAELAAIMGNSKQPTAAALYLQAMTEYTNEKILPVYYNQSLKIKYANDQPTAQMIDIVRNGITSPFEMVYGTEFGRPLYVSVRDSVKAGSNVMASTYTSIKIADSLNSINKAYGITIE